MNKDRDFGRRNSSWLGVSLFSLSLLSCLASSCREDTDRVAPPRPPVASAVIASTAVTAQRDFVHASDVLLPESLGVIQARFDGKVDQPLIFVIGEDHVALPVQQAVADLLSYLHSAYDVRVIGTEGMSGSLPLPATNGQLVERRLAAKSELLARHINAVGYIALSYPDVRVVGVEDMDAYGAHKEALKRNPPELEAWLNEIQSFIDYDASSLPEADALRVSQAVKSLASDKDFDRFLKKLGAVAPNSDGGRKLANLLSKRKSVMAAAKKSAAAQTKGDDPLMSRRNEAMSNAAIGNSPNSGSMALVVGSLHLQGIADKLKAAGRPFVSILAAGVPPDPDYSKVSKEDAKVYDAWTNQEPTALESWLPRMNPPSTLLRDSLRNKLSLLGALVNADRMLREGSSPEEVLQLSQKANLPSGLDIQRTYQIPGGYGIEFTFSGKPAYFYASSKKLPFFRERYPGQIEHGEAGGQFWAVFDGGAGKKPPILPLPPGAPSTPPGGDFGKRLIAAVGEQNRKNDQKAVLAFIVDQGTVFRTTGASWLCLGIPAADVRKEKERFEKAKAGPERLLAAQRLTDALLAGIDQELPSGRVVLHQVSQDDLLGDLSLPTVAAMAGEPTAAVFSKMKEVYAHSWQDIRNHPEVLNWSPKAADIAKTVLWIATGLQRSEKDEQRLGALEATGVRINEAPQPGDALILLGGGHKAVFQLRDGSQVSSKGNAFKSAIRDAEALVAFNVTVPASLSPTTEQLRTHELSPEDAFPRGLDLMEKIHEESGRKTLDEILREGEADKRAETRKNESRRDLLEHMTEAARAQLDLDTKATVVRRAK